MSQGFIKQGTILNPNVTLKSSTYTILSTDSTIICTSGTFTVTLPTAINKQGQIFLIKNSGNGLITINTTLSQTIDGVLSITCATNISYSIQSNGTNYIII
jgi:hypothetical protein